MNLPTALPYEPRPRDCALRLRRASVPTLGTRRARRHRGRRLLVLLAAIAVPALAAPSPWQAFGIGDAGDAQLSVDPMPFEQPPRSIYHHEATNHCHGILPKMVPTLTVFMRSAIP